MSDDKTNPELLDSDEAAEMAERLKIAQTRSAEWRKNAKEDYAFVCGDQWDSESAQVLRDQNRPVITFNRIAPIIDSVAGTEVSNRQEVRYIPRQAGDVGVNELLTGAAEWVRDQCDAEDEESDAFFDTLVCGMGWTETRLDYERDPDGQILIERVDPLEMYWDPSARKRNVDDARWLLRSRLIDEDDFEAMWPDKKGELGAGGDANTEGPQGTRVVNPKRWYEDDQQSTDPETGEETKGKYRVVEYQWCERETFWRVVDSTTGQAQEFSDEQFLLIEKRARAMGVPLVNPVRQKRKVYYRAFYCQGVELENKPSPCKDSFTYKCITGKRDRNAGTWFGMVRAMKDPQRWANKWLSQVLHIINSNAKGGVMYEADAVESIAKFEENWAKTDGAVKVRPGALSGGKIQPKPEVTFPAALDHLMQFAISSLRDVSGVNLEMLGMADRQQAGILEQTRKQAAMVVLATLFDGLRRYRKEQGRVLLYFITNYISDGRLIKIAADGTEKYVPLVRDPNTAVYDVIVDDSPTSPNQKEKTWEIMQPMLPIMMKLPLPPAIWPEILNISPLPTSFTEKVKQIMEMQAKQPPQEPPEVQKAKMDAQIKQQSAQMDAQATQSKAQSDMQLAMAKAQQDIALKREAMQADIEMQRAKMQADHELAVAQAQFDAQLAAQKAENEIALANRKAGMDEQRQAHEMDMEAHQSMSEAPKDPARPMKSMVDGINSLAEAHKTAAELHSQSFDKLATMLGAMAAHMGADKEIVRDPKTGRALGVKSRMRMQ